MADPPIIQMISFYHKIRRIASTDISFKKFCSHPTFSLFLQSYMCKDAKNNF